MKLSTRMNYNIIIQFLKFSLVGLSNTIITYCVYCLLLAVRMQYIFAYIIGFLVGMINSFFFNNKFVFPTTNKKGLVGIFFKMTIVYFIIGIVLGNVVLFVLVEKIYISKYFAPIIVLIITTPLNFIFNKYWAFNTTKED